MESVDLSIVPKFGPRIIRPSREAAPAGEAFLIFLSYMLLLVTFPISIWFCFLTARVYERAIIFRLGRLRENIVYGPGLIFILPCVDRFVKVDLRTQSFNVNPQEILTRDSVTIQVDGVIYYNIQNPLNSVLQISNVRQSTKFLAQTTLRNVVGTKDLVELLSDKDSLSKRIEQVLDDVTFTWGVKVERVEIKGGVRGPGLIFILPCVDEFAKVDLRTQSFDVHPQEVLTRDSVTIQVDAVVYYSIRNPLDSVIHIRNVHEATKLLSQTTLRNVMGTKNLMELLTAKETLSRTIEVILDEATDQWGVKVERVELKQIHLPTRMQKAMAAEREAEREAQAKIVAANGELAASKNLREASDVMITNPVALQLRYLQTLNTISNENNHTVVFPFPMDLLKKMFTPSTQGGMGDSCCNDPTCCPPTPKSNKKNQTKPEKLDIGV